MTAPLDAIAGAVAGEAWLVGGAVRDRLLDRETSDFDLVLAADPEPAARAIARAMGGHVFPLSEAFGGWRVVAHTGAWQIDLTPLAGPTIEDDLDRRDLTINAIAQPLHGGELIDRHGGREDLSARRLRMVSAAAFDEDPLRALRLARLAAELAFDAEPATVAAASRRAAAIRDCSPERVFGELKRLIVAPAALAGLELMDACGVTAVVLPELGELHAVEQNRFHHLDVHDHTIAVLAHAIELELDPEPVFGEHAGAVSELLAEPLADGLTRGGALRFGALMHDIAKPQTRAVTTEGRVTFMAHDALGAELSRSVLARLRASERLGEHVAALTRHHLRLGFLVHEMPLSRSRVYEYLRATAPVSADVTVLSVADRLATRGDNAERAIARHLELAREVIGDALAWRRSPPRPPVRGDELAGALGIAPGPELGRLLSELERLSFTGEVASREQAIAAARELIGQDAGAAGKQ